MDRRTMITGVAGLSLAGVALPALPAASDLMIAMQRQATAHLRDLRAYVDDGAEGDVLFDKLSSLREQAFDLRATTLPGALASLEWARAEFAAYYIDGLADSDTPDWIDRFTLNLLDGTIAVLRQTAGGGVA